MDDSNDEYKNIVFIVIIVLVNVLSINLFAFAYPNVLWKLMKQLRDSVFELLTDNSFMAIMSVQKSKKKMENRQRNQIISGASTNNNSRPLLVRGLINANWANVQPKSAEKVTVNRQNGEVDSKGSKRQQKIKEGTYDDFYANMNLCIDTYVFAFPFIQDQNLPNTLPWIVKW